MKYLALGDSYTIGELVDWNDNFPNQCIRLLQKKGILLELSGLIAVTGWTTDELMNAIEAQKPASSNDWVSLLIGVNNQYRGRSIDNYREEFEALLKKSIELADAQPKRVVVLSIPDWGLTPFAKEKDSEQISREIDAFNAANQAIAAEYGVGYIDITASTRRNANNPSYLASDQLHPSALEYTIWAEKLADWIASVGLPA